MPLEVHFHLTGEHARVPARATDGSAGFDLFAAEAATIGPGKRALVGTGVRLSMHRQLPLLHKPLEPARGVYARVAPRSGLAVRGIDVAAGVCDADYRGEYKVLLVNHSDGAFVVEPGDRIAQLLFEQVNTEVAAVVVESADQLEYASDGRGEGGFGSTGTA